MPTVARRNDGWRSQAACRDLDVRMFYPDTGKRSGPAVAVCAGCVVRAACLEHALTAGESHGVWGGKSEDERRAIRRARKAAS
ncbi:WhiB family transcriptional regulator [Actinomycetospora sp.]|jgi:WhiB family redox-sensing transcriptional regulator|uniref:WhiB family transcriptional regulator n=1 Tax=Actinomycetospora sp. TaxID=1872135 RepID=UPI002F402603